MFKSLIQSSLYLFCPISPLQSNLVLLDPILSILSTIVQFGPIQSIRFMSIHFSPSGPLLSIQFGPLLTNSVHIGLFQYILVYFGPFLSTLVHFKLFSSPNIGKYLDKIIFFLCY